MGFQNNSDRQRKTSEVSECKKCGKVIAEPKANNLNIQEDY